MRTPQQHQQLVELAQRIVLRYQQRRYEVVAELIARALATSDEDQTFALALALTDQALSSVEESRLDAVTTGRGWQPAMPGPGGVLITPADTSVAPIPLAMRLIDAMHRSVALDKDDPGKQRALADLGVIYETAAAADIEVFRGLFAALASYAAHGRAGDIEITLDSINVDAVSDDAEDAAGAPADVFVADSSRNSGPHFVGAGSGIPRPRTPFAVESPQSGHRRV